MNRNEAFIEICVLIYFQDSLKNQDRWLERVINAGLWKPPVELSDFGGSKNE